VKRIKREMQDTYSGLVLLTTCTSFKGEIFDDIVGHPAEPDRVIFITT